MKAEFSSCLECGGRRPHLVLVKGTECREFGGELPTEWGVVVTATDEVAGKWSGTKYVLELARGVRAIHFLSPLHGRWGENYLSWGEVVLELGLPVEQAKQLVGKLYPTAAKRLDDIEAFEAAQETAGEGAELVVVSFGSPTNRQVNAGFWEESKRGRTSTGVEVEVAPGEKGWATPVVVQPAGALVVGAQRTPGHHGGYWAIEVQVPTA